MNLGPILCTTKDCGNWSEFQHKNARSGRMVYRCPLDHVDVINPARDA